MHFCTECQNMYYTRLGGENQNSLIYYCRKCGHQDDLLATNVDNMCISKTHIKTSKTSFQHMVNEFTPLDPTLPHVKNIPCPNSACSSHQTVEDGDDSSNADEKASLKNDVIYLRYDDQNLKYVYICTNCQTVWKSSDN